MVHRIKKVVFLGVVFLGFISAAQAENGYQGGIKGRIQQHMLEKLQSMPAPEVNASSTAPITKSGDYNFSIQHGGLKRMYRVHVPSSYTPAKPTPLLVAFHGGGGNMNYMARDDYYGLISKSNKEGFIVAFPNGYSKFPSGIFATWNAGECCGDARDQKVDDVGFVRVMIDNLSHQMNIDRHRVYATGMSNGGMMAERLACDAADLFAGIASVAGTDNTVSCQPARPISVMNIHAKNDDHVLFNGGAGDGAFRDLAKVTDFTSVPETISRWISRDKCAATPRRILDVNGAYCDVYDSCQGGVKVALCVTETGAHSWPGGYKPRGDATSKALSANDAMWSFFQSLP